jgi:hypothetical protein
MTAIVMVSQLLSVHVSHRTVCLSAGFRNLAIHGRCYRFFTGSNMLSKYLGFRKLVDGDSNKLGIS